MKALIALCLILAPLFVQAKVLEIPFNEKNKSKFYLQNTRIKNTMVEISEGDAVYRKVFNSFFLSFENSPPTNSNISLFKDSIFGTSSGLFYESRNFVRFNFENRFDFGMVLEFWLKPFTVDNGTVLSTEHLSPDGVNRHFEVFFKSGKLNFAFHNLFIDESVPPVLRSLKISSDKIIPLKEWHHHRLTYNPTTGEINYYMDGKLVSQTWATRNKQPGASVMYLETPQNWDYVLGKGYRGLMDNFFLSANVQNQFKVSIHDKNKGTIHTRVLPMPGLASIYDIDLLSSLPKDSYLTLEYRASQTPFSDNTPAKLLPWKDYNLMHRDTNTMIKTRYIQFRVTLFPSPDGKSSPLVKAMRVKYNRIEVPTIPLGIRAVSSGGKLILSFRESPNKNIVAYKVYYGNKKNQYWGSGASEGSSPILLPITEFNKGRDGRMTFHMNGLELFKVYYLRITALNHEGLESEMSKEVSVRIRKLR